jgi:hypothetical protein
VSISPTSDIKADGDVQHSGAGMEKSPYNKEKRCIAQAQGSLELGAKVHNVSMDKGP